MFDLLLTGNGKKAGAEIKMPEDFWGSLRERLRRQCMDIAVTCDYGYLAIMGSEDDLRAAIPKYVQTREDGLVQKTEDRISLDEDMMLSVLGDIKQIGITTVFLSKNPIFAFRTLLTYMLHDIIDEPPLQLITKPIPNMHAINVMCNLPGVGWERADALLKQFGSVTEFMMVAQACQDSGDFSKLENLKINNRKFGKSAHKMFEVEGIWNI